MKTQSFRLRVGGAISPSHRIQHVTMDQDLLQTQMGTRLNDALIS